ncbi:MAG: IS1380 family transposase [Pseudomonadota bacterium]
MKPSKSEIRTKAYKVPTVTFAQDGQLTSLGGLVFFQALFARLRLKDRLNQCFRHLGTNSAYGAGTIFLLLTVHVLIGCRRLSEIDDYRGDPCLERLLGLRVLPTKSTLCRALQSMGEQAVENVRHLVRGLVNDRLEAQRFARLTLDFDGSVQSTTRHAEQTAMGFNPKKKGARSYYPLFCTIAQTSQFFDMLHRSGNVHDSSGACDFAVACFQSVRTSRPRACLESRMDSAFFSDAMLTTLAAQRVEFTISVPFERFAELKGWIESRKRWRPLDERWSFFEREWKAKSWNVSYRLLFLRQRRAIRRKGPLQLDLFEPRDYEYEYTVIATNKRQGAHAVRDFHHGRGSQEKLFGEGKQHAALDLVATRRIHGNQLFTLAGMLAHNLGRELQMATRPPERKTLPKRPPCWIFVDLGTLQRQFLRRAAQLLRPQGQLTIRIAASTPIRRKMLDILKPLLAA